MKDSNYSIERYRDKETGQLVSYAWPGGYQVMYYTQDNNPLCPECAVRLDNECRASWAAYDAVAAGLTFFDARQLDEYWALVYARDAAPIYADIFYEGAPEHCAECSKEIESAYGDPDDDQEEAAEQ